MALPGCTKAHTVAVLGASPKPERYAYRALLMLREYGHRVIPVNPAFESILGERSYASIRDIPEKLDTVTVYVSKRRSDPLIGDIVAAKPARIILNPGAENAALSERAAQGGIEVVEGCTLVMLRSGLF